MSKTVPPGNQFHRAGERHVVIVGHVHNDNRYRVVWSAADRIYFLGISRRVIKPDELIILEVVDEGWTEEEMDELPLAPPESTGPDIFGSSRRHALWKVVKK